MSGSISIRLGSAPPSASTSAQESRILTLATTGSEALTLAPSSALPELPSALLLAEEVLEVAEVALLVEVLSIEGLPLAVDLFDLFTAVEGREA